MKQRGFFPDSYNPQVLWLRLSYLFYIAHSEKMSWSEPRMFSACVQLILFLVSATAGFSVLFYCLSPIWRYSPLTARADCCTQVVRWKYRRIVWCSCLSVPQLLKSPSPLLTNRGTMLWDKVCWLLALLALSSGGLPPSNEPLSAPRIFLSFKGKALKILVCLWPSLLRSVFLNRHVDGITAGCFCHQSFISWSCSVAGLGKLLAPAEFRAWQA